MLILILKILAVILAIAIAWAIFYIWSIFQTVKKMKKAAQLLANLKSGDMNSFQQNFKASGFKSAKMAAWAMEQSKQSNENKPKT